MFLMLARVRRRDVRDANHVPVPLGIYLVRVRIGEQTTARKIFVMR